MNISPLPEVAVAHEPRGAERTAVRVLQLGALGAVLVASTYREFELDRFFIPKELGLHLTAALACFLLLQSVRRAETTRVDLLLVLFLFVGTISTLFDTNHWAAWRAFAISTSGVAIFWSARALREAGLARPVVVGVSVAAVAAALTCLLQAYGVTSDFFSLNRSPGGTLGNRNFIAHLVAFSLPVLLLSSLRAWRPLGFLIGAGGAGIAVWALILTRSRAAWIGLGVVLVVMLAGSALCRPIRRSWRLLARLTIVLGLAAVGVAGAVMLPNRLEWRSETPYRETATGLVNFREGSGRGRLVQYGTSLSILLRDPLFGAGPGNWQVVYPARAQPGDPSLSAREPGMTSNPWPSSDWIAFLTERGLVGAGLLIAAAALLVLASWRRLQTARDAEEGLAAVTCLAIVSGVAAVGAFDAVLLLAWPTLLVWCALGALWTPETAHPLTTAPGVRVVWMLALAIVASVASVRSLGQLSAMSLYADDPGRRELVRAARLDPGNFRVRMAAARSFGRREDGRCEHARAARDLFPASRSAQRLAAPCE